MKPAFAPASSARQSVRLRDSTPGAASARARRGQLRAVIDHRAPILAALASAAVVAGSALHAIGQGAAGDEVWGVAVTLLAAELFLEVIHTVVVDHHMGVDTIALVAMIGSLALGEELVGLVVGLMFSGGAALEDFASTRARRELTALVQRAPKFAQLRIGERIERVPIERVQAGDVVMVRNGEVIPVDGTLVSDVAVIDAGALTGEPLPARVTVGMSVLSGTSNAGAPFDVKAQRTASDSAYAALVRLVELAQADRAPFVRMADRYAGFFLPVTLLIAAAAWGLSGDPVRALAVVVVATPCPLILAAPIAFVSGISRAARSGVIVKGAGPIEMLGHARTVLFDKTGTLTTGTPAVRDVLPANGFGSQDVLALAASVDQVSAHVLGEALVHAATDSGLLLSAPTDVGEQPGQGIQATVNGCRVAVGSRAYLLQAGVAEAELRSAIALSGYGRGRRTSWCRWTDGSPA